MNALTNNTATLFRRYLWLLDVIYSAGRITLDEIRVRWQRNEMSGGEELPRKTFENHRKAVEELFDVNIACDRRTNEYYVECGDGRATSCAQAVGNLRRERPLGK